MKRYMIPAISAVVFDIVSIIAIVIRVYHTEGQIPPLSEVIFSSPICYFWLLWTALIFFCVNGIVNEYRIKRIDAENTYPLLSKEYIHKQTLIEFVYSYSKKLLPVFGGLPLAYFLTTDIEISDIGLTIIILLLIPFMLDIILLFGLVIYRKCSLTNSNQDSI